MEEEIKEILLERWELKILIENIDLHRKDFDAPIVEKAGHKYKPSTGHSWGNLDSLNDVELFCLYRVCRSSYRRSLSKEEFEKEGCKNKLIHPREVDEAFLAKYGGRNGYKEWANRDRKIIEKEKPKEKNMFTSMSKELNSIDIPFFKGEVSMLPFDLEDLSTLPLEFRETAKEMIKDLPNKVGEAFLTVHGKFVKKSKTLRRGAPHIDGNYIKDVSAWGSGGGNGWKVGENGMKLTSKEHALSYENKKGGMLIASNYSACMGWNGVFNGKSGIGGDCSHLKLNEGFKLKSNKVYYGNSQFVHESLPLDKDVHRVMYRITLPINHEYKI